MSNYTITGTELGELWFYVDTGLNQKRAKEILTKIMKQADK